MKSNAQTPIHQVALEHGQTGRPEEDAAEIERTMDNPNPSPADQKVERSMF